VAARATTVGGRYRSLFVVGKGGMGSVEAALQESGDRVVALKRLLPDAARDRRRVDMFLREAKLAAMLSHPNVVTAYDYGEIDGELYLAMEYVEGQPLSRVLRALAETKEELPVSLVAYVLSEVCRGLHAAHELTDPATGQALNLVHRDVSPQNVMLGYDGRVRLLDFGVAKIETESVTKTGEVKGKTAYMSPEQAMGDPLDRRSDLFSVGALLFECLALRRMWGDGTDMEVIRKLALESPPGLEETGRSALPSELIALHAKLVAHDREGRPATAEQVATTLDALVPDAAQAQIALQALLDEHFAEHAKEQRAKLDSSLNEVVPDHASALRASVHPSNRPTEPEPIPAVVAPAAASRSRSRLGLVAAGVAIAGLAAWKALTPGSETPKPDPAPAVTSAALPATPASPSVSPVSTPIHVAPPPASTMAPAAVSIAPSPRPLPPPSPGPVARPSAPAPKPVPSAKPPDVDDHPF
jgi:serine/threonine-protein kinase